MIFEDIPGPDPGIERLHIVESTMLSENTPPPQSSETKERTTAGHVLKIAACVGGAMAVAALVFLAAARTRRDDDTDDAPRRSFRRSHASEAEDVAVLIRVARAKMDAMKLVEKGCLDEAEPLYRRALLIEESLPSSSTESITSSVESLAMLMRKMGRMEEAEALYVRSLAAKEAALGVAHPSTLLSVGSLAALLEALGGEERADEASALQRRARLEPVASVSPGGYGGVRISGATSLAIASRIERTIK